jgi:hypothetical protein
MSRHIYLATILFAGSMFCAAQQPADTQTTPPPTGNTPLQQQKNAASATKDNSGTTGDQITKPAAAKGSTLIGCLSGPDKAGKFVLKNMSYRTGVQVLGPDDLKNDSGSKVKLTGQWQPAQSPAQDKNTTELRRFQVTDVEVVASTCHSPSETTPVSKEKRGKTTTYEAPSADSGK